MTDLHMDLSLRRLRTFVAAAETGGVARAAARVHLTQPAASRQILALESELGVPLFDRVGRTVKLTAEGEDVLRRSRRLLEEAEALAEHAKALKKGETGLLRIGSTPHVTENVLAPFLSIYKHRHPGIEVQLVEDGGARMAARLRQGDAHLAIMPAGQAGFGGRLLFPMHAVLVMLKGHRLARSRVLEVEALAEESLLLLDRSFATREWFDAACSMAHIHPRVLLESAAAQALIALAQADYGLAVVSSQTRFPAHGVKVTPLVHRGAPIGKWAIVGWDEERSLPSYGRRFAEELAAAVGHDYPGRALVRCAPQLPRPRLDG